MSTSGTPDIEPRGTERPEPAGPTVIETTVSIKPLRNIMGDVAGLLGESIMSLMLMFYQPPVCKKANIVISELVTNVLENVCDPDSGFVLRLAMGTERLVISVQNQVPPEVASRVMARVNKIHSTGDPRRLLVETIRERRLSRLKGGLGLLRLVAENKFHITTDYQDGILTVQADYRLESLP
jgi:hypothetical protein